MGDDSTVLLKDIDAIKEQIEEEGNGTPALILIGGESGGALFDLKKDEMIAGRSKDGDIYLPYEGISRKHFKLTIGKNSQDKLQVILEDLGSKNGTLINNRRLYAPVTLRKGDVIKLGHTSLKFLPAGDPERITYEKLKTEATTDGLTKCYNKKYFTEGLNTEFLHAQKTGHPLTMVIFDLDHFKKLNDNHGHDAGDFVLKNVAGLIHEKGLRGGDIFARYGGEEFCILFPNTNVKSAFEIAERIRKLIESHPFVYEGKILPVTCSVGVADYRPGVKNSQELFKRADAALYQSKNDGRNKTSFYKDDQQGDSDQN